MFRLTGHAWLLLAATVLVRASFAGLPAQDNDRDVRLDFLDGDYDQVVEVIDGRMGKGEQIPFALLHLRARAMKHTCLRYATQIKRLPKGPGPEQKAQLRAYSTKCTKGYEEALAAGQTAYEKACLAAEWWGDVYTNTKFDRVAGNSAVLRTMAPHALAPKIDAQQKETIRRQTMLFRGCFRGLLDVAKSTCEWSAKQKCAFTDSLGKEFASLAVIGVPDDVLADILRDLPAFVCSYMPVPTSAEKPVSYRNTMRWYLWKALTHIPPDATERRAIDSQYREHSTRIVAELRRVMNFPRLKPDAEDCAKRFLAAYELSRDNRFIPYGKRAVHKYEIRKADDVLNEQLRQAGNNLRREARELADAKASDEEYEMRRKRYSNMIYAWLFRARCLSCRPASSGKLPGEWILTASGRFRGGHWVYRVGKVIPYDAPEQ